MMAGGGGWRESQREERGTERVEGGEREGKRCWRYAFGSGGVALIFGVVGGD